MQQPNVESGEAGSGGAHRGFGADRNAGADGRGTWRCFEAVRPVSMLPATAYAMSNPDQQPE
jgi:hypothetical protein